MKAVVLTQGIFVSSPNKAFATIGSGSVELAKQSSVDSLFTSVSNGKTQVANAITGKGVAASGSDSFATLANKISQIKSVSTSPTYDTGEIEYLGNTSTSFPAEDDYFTFSFVADGKYSGTNATRKAAKTFNLGNYAMFYMYVNTATRQAYYNNGASMYVYIAATSFNGGYISVNYIDNNYDWVYRKSTNLSLSVSLDSAGSVSISATAITLSIPFYDYNPMNRLYYRVVYWLF